MNNLFLISIAATVYETIGILLINREDNTFESPLAPLIFIIFWPFILIYRHFKK
jgi:hypothetical protein